MKFLFVHQNFPGQYLHIVMHLLRRGGHEIVFISEPNNNAIAGVRRVNYQLARTSQDGVHPHIRDFDLAARRAEIVYGLAVNLRSLGFTPDVIIGHHGWGEMLGLPDVWPGVPMLGYFEFFYSPYGQDTAYDPEFPIGPEQFLRIRAMNGVNLLALALDQHGQTPTRWQLSRYPDWAQRRIRLVPEGARLDLCRPNAAVRAAPLAIGDFVVAPGEKLVTYVARNLEPYRGFHVVMRALPALLRARPDVKVVMVGGDDVSYGARLPQGNWRERLTGELAGQYDMSRVLMPGQVPYDTYLALLQRSDAHVYLTYPFVPSWSLREALACGCAVIGADVEPVREFLTEGRTGLLTPGLDSAALARRILDLLENPRLDRRIRQGARRHAEATLDMEGHLAAYEALIGEITGQAPRGTRARAAKG
ncbi:MAG: glycosyltransferase [Rhodospirillales bacterium]|nr:glycosyltransferase [Rhodospirillales bacterium]